MSVLNYKTRSMTNPKGKPRVYFCCHPEDFDLYFDTVCNDVLTLQNCAIWYAEPSADRDGDFMQSLNEMQLFIMPVTFKLLNTSNYALDVEFRFAAENHIPVLPLMFENGLATEFNQKCGDIQYLEKYLSDETAISYFEKLERFLASVLVGDELAEKVRAAFDAYVFLSYRKKDRKYAQELMRLIHRHEFCRDIAIWYDEYLTPGENFNDSIKAALEKSGLFVLTVTPNLVNEENYIMTTEYPMAKEQNKPILPAELVPTDRKLLADKYSQIPNCTDARNDFEMSEALLKAVQKMAIKENDQSPMHNFFIGLAYLNGIDVEVDRERAVRLITASAEAGLPEAIDQLVQMLRTGKGIERSYEKAIEWQKRRIEAAISEFSHNRTDENLISVVKSMIYCGDYYGELARVSEERQQLDNALRFFEDADLEPTVGIQRILFALEQRLGSNCVSQGDRDGAKLHFSRCVEISSNLGDEMPDRRNMAIAFNNIGVYFKGEGELDTARKHFESAWEIAYQNAEETNEVADLRMARICLYNVGGVYVQKGNPLEAEAEFLRALQIANLAVGIEDCNDTRHDKAMTLIMLGHSIKRQGRISEAKGYYIEAVEILKKMAEETETAATQYDLCVAYNDLGNAYQIMGEWAEAKNCYEQALAISDYFTTQNGTVRFKRMVAVNLVNLGFIARLECNFEKAEECYLLSQKHRSELAEMTGAVVDRSGLAFVMTRLAAVYVEMKRFEDAGMKYSTALSIYEYLGRQTADIDAIQGQASSTIGLGRIKLKQGLVEEAKALFHKALEISEKYAELNQGLFAQSYVANCCSQLGNIYSKENDFETAKKYLQKQLELRILMSRDESNAETVKLLAIAHNQMGNLLKKQGHGAMARCHFEAEASAYEKVTAKINNGPNRRAWVVALKNVGSFDYDEKLYEKAEKYYAKAVSVGEVLVEKFPSDSNIFLLADCYNELGRCLTMQKKYDSANAQFLKFVEISDEQFEQNGGYKYLLNRAMGHYNLSITESETDNQKTHLLKAIELMTELCEKEPQNPKYAERLKNYKQQYDKKFGQ